VCIYSRKEKGFSSSISTCYLYEEEEEKVEKESHFSGVRLRPSKRIAHLGDLFLLLGGNRKSQESLEKKQKKRAL
jgi:hypothetical protein